MMHRIPATAVTTCMLFLASWCAHGQTPTPRTSVEPVQQDKVLFEGAMKAMMNSSYAVARTKLQALINNYRDSGYVPLAKLSIADAWYAEGNLKQAEMEYQDFVTFFPKRPEVAQAQSRIHAIRRALEISQ
jgi:outer membrane protein assembly factor BamD